MNRLKKLYRRIGVSAKTIADLIPAADAPAPLIGPATLLALPEVEDHVDGLKRELRGQDLFPIDQALVRFLETVASYVHFLPASELHHHNQPAGLFVHLLDTAATALRHGNRSSTLVPRKMRLRGYREKLNVPAQLALLVIAIGHDLGKIATDVRVYFCDKHGNKLANTPDYQPHRAALFDTSIVGWGQQVHGRRAHKILYRWMHLEGRGSNAHASLWPAAVQILLQRHRDLFACTQPLAADFFDFSARHFGEVIKPLIEQSDHESVAKDLQSSPAKSDDKIELARRLFACFGQAGLLTDVPTHDGAYFLSVRRMNTLLQCDSAIGSKLVLHAFTKNRRKPDAAYFLKQLRGLRLTQEPEEGSQFGYRLQSQHGEPGVYLGLVLAREVAFWQAQQTRSATLSENRIDKTLSPHQNHDALPAAPSVGAESEVHAEPYEKGGIRNDTLRKEADNSSLPLPESADRNVTALAEYIEKVPLQNCCDQWKIENEQLLFGKTFFHDAIQKARINRFRLLEHHHFAASRWALVSKGDVVSGIVCTRDYTQRLLHENGLSELLTKSKNRLQEPDDIPPKSDKSAHQPAASIQRSGDAKKRQKWGTHWTRTRIELASLSQEEDKASGAMLYAKCFFEYLAFYVRSPYSGLPIHVQGNVLHLPVFYITVFSPTDRQLQLTEAWLESTGLLKSKTSEHYILHLTEDLQLCLP